MKNLIHYAVAFFRLNGKIVCSKSSGAGLIDFHDYPDSVEQEPWHFVNLTCNRCNKKFII